MSQPDLSRLRIERGPGSASIAASRRPRRRILWVLAVLAVAGVAAVVVRARAPVAVEATAVAIAYPSQAHTALNATGYVVAQRKAAVASKATGRLEWLGVREGSVVRQGEILARLENRDVTAQLEQAAANIQVAQANLAQGEAEFTEAARARERSVELLAKKFVAQAVHDTAVARYDKAQAAIAGFRAAIAVAQANYRAAQVAVEQTLIRAPFDGVVLTKNANVGDVITPFSSAVGSQAAALTMADMSTLEVEADVSEASIGKVRLEQPCEIQLDALPDTRFRGLVNRIVPTVDRSKATVTVKVRFVDRDARVLPEMSAKVGFLTRELDPAMRAPRTAVQASAIAERDGKPVVYVIRDGKAHAVPVETGEKIGEMVEIVKGAKAGDKVVARPPADLHDGAKVSLPAK
jgi:RND family efflux transporter MFP subunit